MKKISVIHQRRGGNLTTTVSINNNISVSAAPWLTITSHWRCEHFTGGISISIENVVTMATYQQLAKASAAAWQRMLIISNNYVV